MAAQWPQQTLPGDQERVLWQQLFKYASQRRGGRAHAVARPVARVAPGVRSSGCRCQPCCGGPRAWNCATWRGDVPGVRSSTAWVQRSGKGAVWGAVADLMNPNHPFAELEAMRSPVLPNQIRIYANELQEHNLGISDAGFWPDFRPEFPT